MNSRKASASASSDPSSPLHLRHQNHWMSPSWWPVAGEAHPVGQTIAEPVRVWFQGDHCHRFSLLDGMMLSGATTLTADQCNHRTQPYRGPRGILIRGRQDEESTWIVEKSFDATWREVKTSGLLVSTFDDLPGRARHDALLRNRFLPGAAGEAARGSRAKRRKRDPQAARQDLLDPAFRSAGGRTTGLGRDLVTKACDRAAFDDCPT